MTSSNSQACGEQVASEIATQSQYQQLKLALDVHAASIVVARMIDGAKAQPPQTVKPADFLKWAHKQVALAKEVSSCYQVLDGYGQYYCGRLPSGTADRIAGRDASQPDGHTVGKTFYRRVFAGPERKPSSATITEPNLVLRCYRWSKQVGSGDDTGKAVS